MKTVNEYADEVWAAIEADLTNGMVIGSHTVDLSEVTSLSELHDHVDANEYFIDAGVPFGSDLVDGHEAGEEIIRAVEAEVDRRIRARAANA